MPLAFLAAVIAALAYGAATIFQALGVLVLRRDTQARHAKRKAAGLYASGIALDGVGFAAQATAAHSLPLFFVQAVTASSVAITAVLAVIVLKTHLSSRERWALAAVGLGLVALASAATDGPPHSVPQGFAEAVLVSLGVVIALGLYSWRTRSAGALATAAGLGFSGIALAARVIHWGSWDELSRDAAFWALILHGIAATVLYALALDAGKATAVAAINFGVETLVPSAVGLAVLHDPIRAGFTVIAAVGFALTLGGCLALARQSEPGA